MAYIVEDTAVKPTVVKQFLGLHLDETGDTQIPLGACGYMKNVYITKTYKPKKVDGYRQEFASLGSHPIRGQWHGRVGSTLYHLFACNGHIYNKTVGGNVDLGTLADDVTSFFGFGGNVYIVNGNEYYKWTGSGSISVVQGYRNMAYVSVNPDGTNASGQGYTNISEYEPNNLLNGTHRMKFNTLVAGSIVFNLPEDGITSVDYCKVLGSTVTPTATSLTNGTVTLTIGAGEIGEDFVEIGWTKGTGSRAEVFNNKYAKLYGETNDTRVFLFGNASAKNRIVYSGLADGLASAEYLPANGYMDVGISNTAVLDFVRHQTKLVVNKEDGVHIGSYELLTDTTGTLIVSFPTAPLSDVATKPYGQVRTCNGYPIFVGESIRRLESTSVQDERNTPIISARIQNDLDKVDLSTAITVDYENRWEYWLAVGKTVWIYNYQLDVYSKLELAHTPTSFIVINGVLYMGTTDGYIMKFSEDYEDFNGEDIAWKFEMNFYDFGASYIEKTLNYLSALIQPSIRSGFKVSAITNKGLLETTETKHYLIHNFIRQDFGLMGYSTSTKPQPFRLRLKPKKFNNLKLIFESVSTLDNFTLLEYNAEVEFGGKTK